MGPDIFLWVFYSCAGIIMQNIERASIFLHDYTGTIGRPSRARFSSDRIFLKALGWFSKVLYFFWVPGHVPLSYRPQKSM